MNHRGTEDTVDTEGFVRRERPSLQTPKVFSVSEYAHSRLTSPSVSSVFSVSLWFNSQPAKSLNSQ